jgi:hypothetical protein
MEKSEQPGSMVRWAEIAQLYVAEISCQEPHSVKRTVFLRVAK